MLTSGSKVSKREVVPFPLSLKVSAAQGGIRRGKEIAIARSI